MIGQYSVTQISNWLSPQVCGAHCPGGASDWIQDPILGERQGRESSQRHDRLHRQLRLQARGHHQRPQSWQDLLPQGARILTRRRR